MLGCRFSRIRLIAVLRRVAITWGPPMVRVWLRSSSNVTSRTQAAKGHSDRARNADLARWGQLLTSTDHGRADVEARLDVASALARLSLSDLSKDRLVHAVITVKRRWSEATVARMLSTLRGFTRWLTRQGTLARDPCDSELLRVSRRTQRRPRAVDADAVEAMITAARVGPTDRQRMFWPDRDVALLRFLAGSDARAEEVCGATIAEIDRRGELNRLQASLRLAGGWSRQGWRCLPRGV